MEKLMNKITIMLSISILAIISLQAQSINTYTLPDISSKNQGFYIP